MKKLLLLLFSILISFNSYAEVPPIIGGNTIKDICKIAECVGGESLNIHYLQNYLAKPEHKVFVIDVSNDGKTIVGAYVGFGFPSWGQAKQNILSKCKAVFSSENCQVLFVNYRIADKELYELLTTKSIPPNAYKSGNDWKCNYGYYKIGTICQVVPANATATSSGWKCNTGFTKDGYSCNKVEESMDYIEELKKIKELLDSGVINEEDFEKMKQKIIDNM